MAVGSGGVGGFAQHDDELGTVLRDHFQLEAEAEIALHVLQKLDDLARCPDVKMDVAAQGKEAARFRRRGFGTIAAPFRFFFEVLQVGRLWPIPIIPRDMLVGRDLTRDIEGLSLVGHGEEDDAVRP